MLQSQIAMSEMNIPLASCLCVTHKKPLMLQRVIECFRNQSYANRQMVIVYEKSDEATSNFLRVHKWENSIKIVEVSYQPVKMVLGQLRNISIREADGDYVCQWDDDDWYDPDRLAVQMACVLQTRHPACVLSRWIVYDAIGRKAYLSNKRLWEGSILCEKSILQNKPYPEISKGEDTKVIDYLSDNDLLAVIPDMPELYIYTYHGANTWESSHFEDIFNASSELSPDDCAQVIDIMNG